MIGLVSHTYVEARLGRWGLYQRWLRRGGSHPGPRPVISWYGPMVLDPHVQERGKGAAIVPMSACPVDLDEARETTRCIAILKREQRKIIVELYVWSARPVDVIKAVGCSKQTFYNRLYAGYADLLGYFNDVAAGVPLPAIEPVIHAEPEIYLRFA